MWPFSDPELLAREQRKIEKQKRWQRFQFWKKTHVTRWQPTLGERIASTYFPIAYLISLCCLIFYAWRKGIRNRAPSRRLKPSSNYALSSRSYREIIITKESLVSKPASLPSANPEPNFVGSLALSTGSDSSGNAPVPQPLRPFSLTPMDLAPVSRQSRRNSVARADPPEVEQTLGSMSMTLTRVRKKTKPESESSFIRNSSWPQSTHNISMDATTADSMTSIKQTNGKPKRRKSRTGASLKEPPHDDTDRCESEANLKDFSGDLMIALRTGFKKSKSARPRDERSHDESGVSTDGSSNYENFRSRSSSPINRTNKIRQMHFFEEIPPTEAKPKVCRRTSMPLSSSTNEVSSEWKLNTMRRSKSSEELLPFDAAPLVVFPARKAVEDMNNSCTEPRDFRLLRLNVHNRTGSMSCGTSVNGSSSICGSLAPSLAGSNFASAELERLKRTIMLRERQAGENERRLSSSTSGSTSSRGSFGPVAQLELLQKRMNAKGENESSAMSSAESLARGDSCRSLNTHESPLVDVFYDPSSDAAPYLTIFYATQSGTSEYYAYALQQEGQTMGIDVGICNVSALMHSVEMSLDQDLKDILVPHLSGTGKRRGRALFLVSTYQEGGPSDDGKSFVKAIQEITDHKYLKGLRYCVFGFGCSSFSLTYNSQGKLYDQMLSQLGGKRMLPLGLGDDSKDIDWDFEQWKWKSWWPTMADIASRDNQGSLKSNQKMRKQESEGHDSKYLIEYINPSEFAKHIGVCDKIPLLSVAKHFGDGAEYTVKIVKPLWRDPELNPKLKQSGSTMHVALDITQPIGTPLTFKTGDNVAVLPHNRSSVVEEVAIKLGYDLDAMFVVHPQDPQQECGFELPFPTPCTIRDYLTKYAELTTPPRRSLIRALSKCATLPEERDELYQLSSKKHREMYKSQVVGQRIGLGEFILVYFKSLEIPLAKFITLCTPMQPRWYSLSGSTVVHKDEIHLTFAMVSLERDMDSSFAQGAASHYLGNLPIGAAVKIIRSVPSGFVVPPDPSLPLIMVANGSGVAPMLALIQERHHQKTELGLKVGPTELFFGIRRRDLDFLYREELRRYKLAGSLSSLQLACSREQMHKIYVQHLIVKHAEHVWRLLQRGAHIYVCGGNRMSNEVDLVLRAIVTRHQEGHELSTEEFMTRLANQGRYLQEAFDSMYS